MDWSRGDQYLAERQKEWQEKISYSFAQKQSKTNCDYVSEPAATL